MKRKKKEQHKFFQSSVLPKISQQIAEFAKDLIESAKEENWQGTLEVACSAWNIACMRPEQRKKQLDWYIQECARRNPDIGQEDVADLRSDMERLIERKLEKFPYDLRQVIDVQLLCVEGRYRIRATAIEMR